MTFNIGDIVEIHGRGDGWDGVQAIITSGGEDQWCWVLKVTENSPVEPPRYYERGKSMGVWTTARMRLAPTLDITPENYEID